MHYYLLFWTTLFLAASSTVAFSPHKNIPLVSSLASTTTKTEAKDALFVDATRQSVQDYYGTSLQSSQDLQTNACCTSAPPPDYIQTALEHIHPTVRAKYYGCGLTLPNYDMTKCRVLDLGCGAGRDVYLASQLVGPAGTVVGVDMTEEQLQTAREHQEHHAKQFGYDNTQFVQGYLEQLNEIEELQNQKFDVIISNCVLNLCTDKKGVLQHCYNLLEQGGEMYFSDVYASRRVPQTLRENELLWGECLSGALYWNDFANMAKSVGFHDPRLVEDAPITIQNKNVAQLVTQEGHGGLEFYSATYRLFKMENLEPACEDYGQAVIYKGTIPRYESSWKLDKGHVFETGKIHPVCGNTWNMLAQNPKIEEHFDYVGDFSKHFGIFEGCGSSMPYDKTATTDGGKGSSSSSSCC